MHTVYVLQRDGHPNQNMLRLLMWFKFHDLEPSVKRVNEDLLLSGRVTLITDDMFPSPHYCLSVLEGKQVVSDIIFQADSEGQMVPSFLSHSFWKDDESISARDLIWRHLYSGTFVHEPSLILEVDDLKSEVEKTCYGCSDVFTDEMRYAHLCTLMSTYWYKIGRAIVEKYYSHLWLNAYQKWALNKDGNVNPQARARYNWIITQSVFVSQPERVELICSLEEAVQRTVGSKVVLGEEIVYYQVKSSSPRSELHHHPLSLPGMYMVEPLPQNYDFDTNVTVVGFYYDLGYQTKPKSDYMDSVDKWIQIKHPLVFYGDADICGYVRERRDPSYTKIFEIPLDEWPLYQRYGKDIDDSNPGLHVTRRPRYSILTNTKFDAVRHAIREDPFNSTTYVWFDPGFYRHHEASEGIAHDTAIFSGLSFEVGKISMPKTVSVPCSTDEQYRSSDPVTQGVLAGMMAGDIQAWTTVGQHLDRFIRSKFDAGQYATEQVVITRLATLKPEFFSFAYANFTRGSWKRFLDNFERKSEAETVELTLC